MRRVNTYMSVMYKMSNGMIAIDMTSDLVHRVGNTVSDYSHHFIVPDRATNFNQIPFSLLDMTMVCTAGYSPWQRLWNPVFKISAGPRTLTGKIWVGPASFPSLSYINKYKFWQNCALVRQVSDLILKTGNHSNSGCTRSTTPPKTNWANFLTNI